MQIVRALILVMSFVLLTGDITKHDCGCRIMESNEINIPAEVPTGLSESEFKSVIAQFVKINGSLAKEKGYELVIQNKWSDGTVNASTTTQGKKWVINAYGGLARYSGMDTETYTMVLCHELGHHLGGFPAVGWASNEGQSDYYASAKCFPRMPESHLKAFNVPAIVTKKCSLQHKSKDEINVCEKTAMVGLNLAKVLNSMSNNMVPVRCVDQFGLSSACEQIQMFGPVSFETPDKTEVTRTDNTHPEAQCRLDTYFAGAICGMPHNEDFSPNDPVTGACAEEKGDVIGVRPHCWYKPQGSQL